MGRRYLLSGRVQIVLRTVGGKHITKNRALRVRPADVGPMSAKCKGGGEVADCVAGLDQE